MLFLQIIISLSAIDLNDGAGIVILMNLVTLVGGIIICNDRYFLGYIFVIIPLIIICVIAKNDDSLESSYNFRPSSKQSKTYQSNKNNSPQNSNNKTINSMGNADDEFSSNPIMNNDNYCKKKKNNGTKDIDPTMD